MFKNETNPAYISGARINRKYKFTELNVERFNFCFHEVFQHYEKYPADKYTYLLVRKLLLGIDVALTKVHPYPEAANPWSTCLRGVETKLVRLSEFCLNYKQDNLTSKEKQRLIEAWHTISLMLATPKPIGDQGTSNILLFRSSSDLEKTLPTELQRMYISH